MIKVNGHLTNVERRMLEVFSDGEAHTREELHSCLFDAEMGSMRTVYTHISNLRRKVPEGYLILREIKDRRYCYRLVRKLTSPNTGRL